MKATQSQAAKRLFKKLSALRATLPNEERAILDRLIVFDDEVSAHKMTAGKVTSGKVTTGKMTGGKVTTGKVTDEVSAHKMTAGKVTSGKVTTGKNIGKTAFQVVYDSEAEEYKLKD
jgi:hypothetical protein